MRVPAGLVAPTEAGLEGAGEAVALTPSGGSVSLPAAASGTRYLALEERGFYTVRPPGTDPERPFVLAVNVELEVIAAAFGLLAVETAASNWVSRRGSGTPGMAGG